MPDSPENHDHLDARRISRLAAVRRAAYRSRSYCIIGAAGCAVGAVELVFQAFGHGTAAAAFLELLGAVGLLGLARTFLKWSSAYLLEARQSELPPANRPPDFSKLSDGSQIAQNLQNMMDGEKEDPS
jgi:hypothetical protein